jgi:hypothetical protein
VIDLGGSYYPIYSLTVSTQGFACKRHAPDLFPRGRMQKRIIKWVSIRHGLGVPRLQSA